jgi:predicted esterase
MLSALVLAASLMAPAPASGTPAPPAAGAVAAPAGSTPGAFAARVEALRQRYGVLWAEVNRPRVLAPEVRSSLLERVAVASQTVDALAKEPDADVLADLERRADLDEQTVPALLGAGPPALAASPGAHVGIVRAGDHDEPFAYWVPRGYDPRKPPPLVALLHGATQPETDLVARAFFRDLDDASGAVLLAPGGDDRDADAMVRSLDAAERALAGTVPTDERRRYVGGFSNGVFSAYHSVATLRERCAGLLGIAGFLRPEDARPVGLRLAGTGVYLVIGASDAVIGTTAVRSNVRVLRSEHVYARYYEVPGAPHALRPLYPAIARAWNDMLRGVTTLDDDGLGTVTDRAT